MTLTCIKMHFRDVHYSSCALNIQIILIFGISPQKENNSTFCKLHWVWWQEMLNAALSTHTQFEKLFFFYRIWRKDTVSKYRVEKLNCFSQNKISIGKKCIINNEIFTRLEKYP